MNKVDVGNITIDPEFKSAIPELWAEERKQLEENILEHGCRDPLVIWGGVILDGHNRYEICTEHDLPFDVVGIDLPDREAALDWIDANQLGRRNLTPDAFRLLIGRRYNRMKKAAHGRADRNFSGTQNEDPKPKKTAEKLAKEHGVSRATVERAGEFAKEVEETPELQEAINHRKPVSKVKREIKREQKSHAQSQMKDEVSRLAAESLKNVCDMRHCSMQELLCDVQPDAIITDPPYPREYISLYEEMAQLASNIPLVAVMCGQSYLPEILPAMCKHLKYRWTLAYLTPGGQAVQQWSAKVNTFWKPIFLFGDGDWIGDVVKSAVNDNDKEHHHWGQSESGMSDLVSRLVTPGSLVCDPFIGGGTTALAVLAQGCRFVGCDTDKESVEKAYNRVAEWLPM